MNPLDPLAVKLREHLEGLLLEMFPVKITDVKKALGFTGDVMTRKVWRRIVEQATEGTPFKVDAKSQSFVLDLAPCATF